MGITSAELASVRITSDGADSESAAQSYEVTYKVDATSGTALSAAYSYFRSHSNLPWNGRTLRCGEVTDTSVVCTKLSIEPILKSDRAFMASATYSAVESGKGDPAKGDDSTTRDPLGWHDKVSISYVPFQQAFASGIFRGLGGSAKDKAAPPPFELDAKSAILNSAGVPFDSVPDVERHIKVIRVTQSIEVDIFTRWLDLLDKYRDTINSDTFTFRKRAYGVSVEVKPRTAKFVGPEAEYAVDNNVAYWSVTTELHIHPKGWRIELIDRGIHRNANAGMKREDGTTVSLTDIIAGAPLMAAIHDTNGDPITTPVLLDGQGAPLTDGSEPATLIYSDLNEVPYADIPWGL